ncbi:M23 family metallopeptidase [Alkalicoccobacillus murimartini]|uniref:Stage IV sporulation protein FA n=1 Tax=Alkalicoccobacillus murimartini TaxID=171685 RepID=A0ABT9YJG6_9BACI|nr:M23 family metallopeptidase [Alkalicoccobacillus murimartini]MDQ0207995.1 stage IV sporulation protein FA [Alkalicoccobacillus murimartini]
MSKQLKQVRKRIEAKRKASTGNRKTLSTSTTTSTLQNLNSAEKPSLNVVDDQPPKRISGSLALRTLFCTLVFLSLLIIYRTDQAHLEPVRKVVGETFQQEFQFAAVSHWYETNFGRPLSLLPQKSGEDKQHTNEESPIELTPYAVPATGTIRENFDQNGRGVMIETGEGIEVQAATGGFVTDITDKDDIGKTVVLQHYDGTESTYGMLDEISVNIYDHIQAGHELGTVSKGTEENKGIYYFALKKGEEYINPNEVITFE